MRSQEVINILDKIQDLLKNKKYQEISEYIVKEKEKINTRENSASEYMDELIKNLK